MASTMIIEWCGVCWLSGGRSLAQKKVRKLPLCDFCLSRFGRNADILDHIYAVWEFLPDTDEDSHSLEKFLSGPRELKAALDILREELEIAGSSRTGGKATWYLQKCINRILYGSEVEPEAVKYWEEKKCLNEGKKTLQKIKSMLRDPQKLREAGSQPGATSQT
jgi:hypothetical protein